MEADRDWLTVAVTAPDHVDGEAWRILRLLTSGAADIVHVRKPGLGQAGGCATCCWIYTKTCIRGCACTTTSSCWTLFRA